MKTYRITVSREITQTRDLEIEAETEDEARDEAEGEIGNIADDGWSDDPAGDPEITEVVELSEDDEAEDDEAENKTPALADPGDA
jgi:hypothetical protein